MAGVPYGVDGVPLEACARKHGVPTTLVRHPSSGRTGVGTLRRRTGLFVGRPLFSSRPTPDEIDTGPDGPAAFINEQCES